MSGFWDAGIAVALCLLTYAAALWLDAFETLDALARANEHWEADELLTALFISPFGLAFFAWRRCREVRREALLRAGAEAEARHLATHDPLTGLANRRRLDQALERALARVAAGEMAALILIDLDRFKPVNDLHGHRAGDRLLQMVATRLGDLAGNHATLARVGGDEFAVLAMLPEGAETAARMASRIVASLEAAFEIGEAKVMIGGTAGIALAPQDGADAELLFRHADFALYRAKRDGRGCFRFFVEDMDSQSRQHGMLQQDLRQAISSGEIEPHFQPLFDLGSGRLNGFEVLARWQHGVLGQVPPDRFIPMAEDLGLIVPLTESILFRACHASRAWPGSPTIAVNLSAVHLSDRALPEMVREVLEAAGFPPGRLELELTESALIGSAEQALANIRTLKAMGVRLALDDFGTGYSSLSHLRTLPFDKIKIDASFVRSMASQPESRKIVAAVVGLGQSLGLPTVAEGIEEAAQAEALQSMGCDGGQGWLFGRPMPAAEAAILAAGRAEAAPAA